TEGNLPSRITKDEQVLHAVKDELILQAVNSFITSIRSIHVPLDEAIEVIKKNYEKDDQEKGDSDDSSEADNESICAKKSIKRCDIYSSSRRDYISHRCEWGW